MSDLLAITDEDAEGLARLAAAQLRLALRFAERAEAEDDVDKACKLARTSERAARAYRQALLLKLKLQRGVPPQRATTSPAEAAHRDPVHVRMDDLEEAVERLRDEEKLDDEDEDWMADLAAEFDDMIAEGDFAEGDIVAQFARICEALELPLPAWAPQLAMSGEAELDAAPPDSS